MGKISKNRVVAQVVQLGVLGDPALLFQRGFQHKVGTARRSSPLIDPK